MMVRQTAGGEEVAEVQGLYGPFVFPERLLQSIWHHCDFDAVAATTVDGRKVTILKPGQWNRLGGPDFTCAHLRLGDREVFGDVEVHLWEGDWNAHGHARDPAYKNVVLHVVLFPPHGTYTAGAGGGIPILPLLPLLHRALEEYAADDAIERLADEPGAAILRSWEDLSAEELRRRLRHHAELRWRQKVHFAKVRIDRLGWTEACHQTALEIFGYRFNRSTMLAVAGAHPLEVWANPAEEICERCYLAYRDRWARQGARPANHPLQRLRQYARWVQQVPAWPARLADFDFPDVSFSESFDVQKVRRAGRWAALERRLAEEVTGALVGGSRFRTLVCDGFLPLSAAAGTKPSPLQGFWYGWPAGDAPAKFTRLLVRGGRLGLGESALCNGAIQGLMGAIFARESSPSDAVPTSAGRGA